MMLTELLATLRDLNVQLSVEGDNLKCKAPPKVLTPELTAQLKAKKTELIAALKQARHSETAIPLMPRGELIPLSFAQQRLWFLNQLEPDSAFYNICIALRLTGKLNQNALKQSLNEIVRRHESLRTAFIEVNGTATQKILNATEVSLQQLCLMAEPQRETLALECCQREAEKPFVLSDGQLFRASLIKLSEHNNILLVTLHHIITDGWSDAILTREFATLYSAFSTDKPSPLPELRLQYADFAYWQRHWLAGERLEQQSQYWQHQLKNAPAFLELPTDAVRPSVMTHHGANYEFLIPSELTSAIKQLAQRYQATLFMTLLSAYFVLLARYSSQTDLCVGSPFAGRTREELEDLIGFFVNTIVLRADLNQAQSIEQLINQVKNTVVAATAHQDLPFEQLVEWLQPERNRSYSPLFQVMFVLQNTVSQTLTLPDLNVSLVEHENTAAKFDLTLHIYPNADALTGVLEYNTDLFKRDTMSRMAQHYVKVLQAMIEQPTASWSTLPLLTTHEYQKIVFDWNNTKTTLQHCENLAQLFEQQALKTPNALAVAFENQTLTYNELNDKANQLAHRLIEQGIKPDMLVGLCVERGLTMMIGMLGILKAGGAYLPLDPSYPEQRLRYMLEDSQATLVLTQHSLINLLPNTRLICLDTDWQNIATHSTNNPNTKILPLHLAYMIYTSGSTGQPKGVLISHHNAIHSTTARFEYYKQPVRSYLMLSSFAFDSSIAGLFWTLGQGGCLVLPNTDQSKDPLQLGGLIDKHHISHVLALPSLYALLLKQAIHLLDALQVAIVAGEASTTELVKQHYALLPNTELHNEYGPTENSVWSSACLMQRTDQHISIGRPIPNVTLYLLDKFYNPVPVGVVGEIYLAGEGLARGYLNRPDLTAEKFIPNPFAVGRLYKTGDLAKYRADGCIEFLGRIDHQIKLRGFRIELGEIEARLLELPDIAEAVVLVREQQLLAYLVGNISENALREHLKQILPDYMIPSAFLFLDALPLTANGKLNRDALPLPNFQTQTYTAPRNDLEKQLCDIWQQVLELERVGIHDDFFALGGHSLLATQLLFAVRNSIENAEQRLNLKNFFAEPTIAAQAKLILGESDYALNLADEVTLADDIQPLNSTAQSGDIFLTGATGFLGAFLLADLIEQTDANIYCLIRAADEATALQRLKQQLTHYQLLQRVNMQRVIAVCGDLAKHNLSLNAQRYREIAERVSVIYHNGALVNFIQPYQHLKAANVQGTQQVIKLAATTTPKAIHYVSTLSVFNTNPPETGFQENDNVDLTEAEDGYTQSKWVAEKIIMLAKHRGFQVSIYRPATVAGDSINGVCNLDDFSNRVLKGCIQLGYAPNTNTRLEIAPVDYISHAIVQLSKQHSSIGACFHLNSPHATYTQDLLNFFNQAGFNFQRVSYAQWTKHLNAATIENFALAPLVSLFPETEDTQQTTNDTPLYACQQTQNALQNLGITCPLINDSLLKTYLNYFMTTGFLQPN